MNTLPIEIQDKIFLYLDWDTLNDTRSLQSNYIKNKTKYDNINTALRDLNIDNVIWLRGKNQAWPKYSFCKIIGNIRYMEIFKAYNCPIDEETFSYSAYTGNLKMMKWLKEAGCPWDSNTLFEAVKRGNIENIKWLIENKCPNSEVVFKEAAYKNNINIMKMLKDSNCPWDEYTFYTKPINRTSPVITWLKENGYNLIYKYN